MVLGHADDHVERQDARREIGLRHVDDGSRARPNGDLEFLLDGPIQPADLDQLTAGQLDSGEVGDPVGSVHDEVARQCREVGESQEPVGYVAGQGRGGRQEESGRRPTGNEGSLVVGQFGQSASGRGLELDEVDEALRGQGHRLHDLARHQRTAEDRERRAAVDDRLDAEAAIDRAALAPRNVERASARHPDGADWPDWRRYRRAMSA